ncbi:YqaA family protein [Elusimicrobiota bacterium]
MLNKILFLIKLPTAWLKKLYDWTIHWSRTAQAPYALFTIAFAESSFFPIPPDVLLIPMVVANRKKWIFITSICLTGSVLGSLLGYFIGWGLYETIGKPIVEIYNLHHAMQVVGQKFSENAFLTIFTAAFTPIPYKAITISAGLFSISLPALVTASVMGRGARFFIVSGALRIFGEKIEKSIEKYFDILSIAFIALLIGGFILLKYVLK